VSSVGKFSAEYCLRSDPERRVAAVASVHWEKARADRPACLRAMVGYLRLDGVTIAGYDYDFLFPSLIDGDARKALARACACVRRAAGRRGLVEVKPKNQTAE
jgi:hypothetical protein